MTHFLQDNDPAWCPATLSHTKPFPEPSSAREQCPWEEGWVRVSESIPEYYYPARSPNFIILLPPPAVSAVRNQGGWKSPFWGRGGEEDHGPETQPSWLYIAR